MTLRILILAVAGAVLATISVAGAASAVLLKPAVIVSGDIVRLGDLFSNLPPEKADLPAAYAPRPGERAVFDVERLADIAHAQGVAWVPQSRFDRAVVERASRLIDRNQIIALLTTALRKSGVGKDDKIELDNESLRLFVPADATDAVELRDLRFDPQTRRFSATLVTEPDAGNAIVAVTGRAVRIVSLPELARKMDRNEIISARDIQWVQAPADRLDATVIADEKQLVGMAARHLLRPGEPIRTSDVQPPILVNRGAVVTMIYRTPYMVITTRGKAVQDSAKGDTIRVMNVESKRELDAVVADGNTVIVQSAAPVAIN